MFPNGPEPNCRLVLEEDDDEDDDKDEEGRKWYVPGMFPECSLNAP
jgi:hypothetical protein